jgi:hypothetical protein
MNAVTVKPEHLSKNDGDRRSTPQVSADRAVMVADENLAEFRFRIGFAGGQSSMIRREE